MDDSFYDIAGAIGSASAADIIRLLDQNKPKRILDVGAGRSTILFNKWAKENGATVVSLDDNDWWAKDTEYMGRLHDVELSVTFAPLKKTKEGWWYDIELTGKFDFALIDGPMGIPFGRKAVLPMIKDHLSKDAVILLDDADRQGEIDILDQWSTRFNASVELVNPRLARIRL